MVSASCTLCGGSLLAGYLKNPIAHGSVTQWVPEEQGGFWSHLMESKKFTVKAMACTQCGHVQFAVDPAELTRRLKK